jgi:DNA-binding NtrC family response regulator
LRNMISSMVVMKQTGMIEADDLPDEIRLGSEKHRSLYVPVPLDHKRGEKIGLEVLAASLLELRHDIREIKALLEGRPSYGSGMAIPVQDAFVDVASSEIPVNSTVSEREGDLRSAEKALIISALQSTDDNRRLAAEKLGISERTLYRKIKSYGL